MSVLAHAEHLMNIANAAIQSNPIQMSVFAWSKKRQDLVFVEYNQALNDMCGGNIEAMIGLSIKEFKPQDPKWVEAVRTCYKKQKKIELRYTTIIRSNGKKVTLDAVFVPVQPDQVFLYTRLVKDHSILEVEHRALKLLDLA